MQGNGGSAGLASVRFRRDLPRSGAGGAASSCRRGVRRGAGALAAHLDVRFISTDGNLEVVLEGEDVSSEIRTQEVANAASKVAAFRAFAKRCCAASAPSANCRGLSPTVAIWER